MKKKEVRKVKGVLVVLLAALLLGAVGILPVAATGEIEPNVQISEEEKKEEEGVKEEEVLLEAPDTKEFVVKKLLYGVTVVLEPDQPIRRPWSKSFTFDIDRNLEDDSSHATTGFWFGNGITSYWITYSRDVHTEDPGRASFSFSYAF